MASVESARSTADRSTYVTPAASPQRPPRADTKLSPARKFLSEPELRTATAAVRLVGHSFESSDGSSTLTGSNQQPSQTDQKATVYVGHLPRFTTAETIQNVFSRYGPVKSIHISEKGIKSESTYAFVHFASPEHAQRARDDDGKVILDGYALSIKPRNPPKPPNRSSGNRKNDSISDSVPENPFNVPSSWVHPYISKILTIANLPDSLTSQQLYDLFVPYGRLDGTFIFMLRDIQGRRVGEASFTYFDDSTKALNAVNGRIIDGKKLEVSHRAPNFMATLDYSSDPAKNAPLHPLSNDIEDSTKHGLPADHAEHAKNESQKSNRDARLRTQTKPVANEEISQVESAAVSASPPISAAPVFTVPASAPQLPNGITTGLSGFPQAMHHQAQNHPFLYPDNTLGFAAAPYYGGYDGKQPLPFGHKLPANFQNSITPQPPFIPAYPGMPFLVPDASKLAPPFDGSQKKVVMPDKEAMKLASGSMNMPHVLEVPEVAEPADPCNLYVKNLDDEWITSTRDLNILFGPYGTISSSHLATEIEDGEPQRSRGYGFVAFSRPEEALLAKTTLNNRFLGKKRIFVSWAERRKDRETRLRAHYIEMHGTLFPSKAQTGSNSTENAGNAFDPREGRSRIGSPTGQPTANGTVHSVNSAPTGVEQHELAPGQQCYYQNETQMSALQTNQHPPSPRPVQQPPNLTSAQLLSSTMSPQHHCTPPCSPPGSGHHSPHQPNPNCPHSGHVHVIMNGHTAQCQHSPERRRLQESPAIKLAPPDTIEVETLSEAAKSAIAVPLQNKPILSESPFPPNSTVESAPAAAAEGPKKAKHWRRGAKNRNGDTAKHKISSNQMNKKTDVVTLTSKQVTV